MRPRREMAVRLFALSMLALTFGSVSIAEARLVFIHTGGDGYSYGFGHTCGTIFGLVVAILIVVFVVRAVISAVEQGGGRRERSRPRPRRRRRDDDDDDDDDWQPRTRSIG